MCIRDRPASGRARLSPRLSPRRRNQGRRRERVPPPQDLFKDKIGLLDSYAVDDRVCVSFNIRGNEWQGRHYVNLQAWRLQNLAAGGGDGYASPPVASSGGASASPFDAPFSSFTADPPADGGAAPKKDDVPF